MSRYTNMTYAKRARVRASKLKVFAREGAPLWPELIDLRVSRCSSTYGRAGMDGWVYVSEASSREWVEHVVIHEFVHVVLHRIRHKEKRQHGQAFRGLLLSACAEIVRLTKAEEREVLDCWQRLKERQREDQREVQAWVDENPQYRRATKDHRIHGYLLDDAIVRVVKTKRGV
jgi:hypothetical protein